MRRIRFGLLTLVFMLAQPAAASAQASVRAPPSATANPLVDAYMYINRPGYSAGSCNGGPLAVGTWWPERALMYAQYGTDWLSPPAGTKYGHFKHFSLRQLGAFG